jgi:ankyrin repeat protein
MLRISSLDVLRKATEKDLNKRDEDGRTPTHWAAFKGNINALILIVSKGFVLMASNKFLIFIFFFLKKR